MSERRGTASDVHAPRCAQRFHGAAECTCHVADAPTMSETTPGPWVAEGDYIRAADVPRGRGVSDMKILAKMWPSHVVGEKENRANARLIASAPDLARKLERAREVLAAARNHLEACVRGDIGCGPHDSASLPLVQAALAELDA